MIKARVLHFVAIAPCIVTCIAGIVQISLPRAAFAQATVDAASQPVNRLKPGDRIRLSVTGFPEMSGEQIIMADGTLQLPLAGSILIEGQTPAEAVNTITTSLLPYIRRPQVGLAVVSIRPPRISVTGEVLRPGPRLLTLPEQQEDPNSLNPGGENFQTVSYALVLAGGVTPNADLRNITIRRLEPRRGTFSQNNFIETEIRVDLWRAIQTGDLAFDPLIADGDEIIVPSAPVSSSEQRQILTSTVSPDHITVQIAGAVRNPGSVQIAPSDGINAAIAAAGGLTAEASQNLTLLRISEGGTLERRQISFGNESEPLREGDVLVASRSTLNSVLDTVGNLLSPITSLFLLFR